MTQRDRLLRRRAVSARPWRQNLPAPAGRRDRAAACRSARRARACLARRAACRRRVVIALVIEAIQNTLSAVIGIVLGQVALAERALINHLVAGRRHRDHAGNLLGLAFLTQNLIDLGFALHGSPPALFLWSGAIFLPAVRSRKRRPTAPAMSRSRDGQGAWAAAARSGGTKLQHFATIRGGRSAMPVTGLTIHDIVISPRFPKPYFLQ